jgi:hypothetical protein
VLKELLAIIEAFEVSAPSPFTTTDHCCEEWFLAHESNIA